MTKTDFKSRANDNDNPPRGGVPRAAFFGSFGFRLYLLLLLIVIPALAITLHEDFSEQRLEKTRLRDEALALSSLAAAKCPDWYPRSSTSLAERHRRRLLLEESGHEDSSTEIPLPYP